MALVARSRRMAGVMYANASGPSFKFMHGSVRLTIVLCPTVLLFEKGTDNFRCNNRRWMIDAGR